MCVLQSRHFEKTLDSPISSGFSPGVEVSTAGYVTPELESCQTLREPPSQST